MARERELLQLLLGYVRSLSRRLGNPILLQTTVELSYLKSSLSTDRVELE